MSSEICCRVATSETVPGVHGALGVPGVPMPALPRVPDVSNVGVPLLPTKSRSGIFFASPKGQAVHCFVVLKNADAFATPEDQASLKSEIESVVVQRLGAFSRPSAIYLVRALPKTRSGKILRRAILAAAERRDTGDLSTLEDPLALDAIKDLITSTEHEE